MPRGCSQESVFLEFGTWNIRCKGVQRVSDWFVESGEAIDFLALQEVGGFRELQAGDASFGDLCEFFPPRSSDLHDNFVLYVF